MAVVAGALLIVALIVSAWVRDLRQPGFTAPVRGIASLYVPALVLYVAGAAYFLSRGIDAGRGAMCVNTAWPSDRGVGPGHAAKIGASITAVGDIQACALHPGALQWALFLLTKLPGIAFWGWLLLLVWRFIGQARLGGPFTAQVGDAIQRLAWFVIAGSMIAAGLSALGADLLTRMLMTPATYAGGGIAVDVLLRTVEALLPVPAIIGAALLSFARIVRAGTVLDEEAKATV